MTRAKRTNTPKIEVHLLREGLVESRHHVEATVCDDKGRVILTAGDPDATTFIRSALKPFQALAIISTGTLERYDLTDKDLAIICSSHQGTIEQCRQVFNVLWRADIEPTALQCPIPQAGHSAIQYNCSGKHAGMLAVCQHRNWPLNTYLHRTNPVQQLILSKVAELLSIPGAELIGAHDDCGAPTYQMQLGQIAFLYAQLASGKSLDLERIQRSIIYHPDMIGGSGTFDTEIMRLSEGRIVSKSGAEGIQCVGLVGEGMGLAIKVNDGAKRAKYAAAIQILKQMGWISPTIAETLSDSFMQLSKYLRMEVGGELSLT